METLNIQFNHPVKGKIQLRHQATKTVKNLKFISDKDFAVHLNFKDLADGDWSASLEWSHNKQLFLIEKSFKIIDKQMAQPAEN